LVRPVSSSSSSSSSSSGSSIGGRAVAGPAATGTTAAALAGGLLPLAAMTKLPGCRSNPRGSRGKKQHLAPLQNW
jgi:hypothetical protein